jgi:hypothetical protein
MSKKKCLFCNNDIDQKKIKHGHHVTCFNQLFNLENDEADFEDLLLKESDGKSGEDRHVTRITSTFYHGAFKKYSARIESRKFILKVREKDYPELPQVEFISNKIAEALGIEVAPYYYILLNNTIPAFCTRNVLDFHEKGNLVHIWHYLKKEDGTLNELTLKNVIQILNQETKRPIDIKKFIELSLLDMVIGNGDRHGRNLALIEKQGKKILAPAYDNPSNMGILEDGMLGVDLRVKGKIFTENSEEPTLLDYISEFTDLGYGSICDDFLKKAKNLDYQKIINQNSAKMSAKRKKAFLSLIKKNLKEIEDDL